MLQDCRFSTPCWTCDLKRPTNKICFSRDSNDFQYQGLGFRKPEIFKTWEFIPVFHKYIQRPNILNQSQFAIHLCISLLPLKFCYEHYGLHYMTPTQASCTIFQRKSFKQIPYISSINFDFARQKRVLTSEISIGGIAFALSVGSFFPPPTYPLIFGHL